jgi:ABC-2 type transport system permease protein
MAIPQTKHGRLYWALLDTWILINRSLKHIIKNPDQLLGSTVQPIMFMMLFRYVFGGAINTGGVTYVNFLVAGILVQTLAFGALTTSLSVATDLKRGIVDRFRSLPMVSSAVITGHVVGDLARNMISATVLIITAFIVGFRPNAGFTEWVMIIGLVLLFTFTVSWVAAIMGLLAKSVESVQWMGFFFVFPLTFASAAFVPTKSMPWLLRLFAENQPVTHVIESLRALMVGTPMGNHGWLAIVWCVGATLITIPITGYLFRKRSV